MGFFSVLAAMHPMRGHFWSVGAHLSSAVLPPRAVTVASLRLLVLEGISHLSVWVHSHVLSLH